MNRSEIRIIAKTSLTTLFVILAHTAGAQNVLSVDEAVNIALKNNYGILVARTEADIAKINNTLGNAGMLPKVSINGSGGYENNDQRQKLANGTENNYPSMTSKSVSLGAQLSWTLFDGGKMFVTKNKLNEIQALGEIQFQEKVLQTQYDVIAAYYNVVKQKQQLNSYNEVINYNRERVKIAETGYNAGSLVKTDLLQAKIDLNVSMENAVNQEYVIKSAVKELNLVLAQKTETLYDIPDSIPPCFSPDREAMMLKLDSVNTSIQASRKQIEIARLALSENKKSYFPLIKLNSGYYYSNTNNSEGSVRENHVTGPQITGSIEIPIFNAGETRRKTAVSKADLQSAEYDLQNTVLQINTDLQNALTGFDDQKKLMEIETENKAIARENFEICIQRLRLGQSNSLEVHQAQKNYEDACTRLINFKYNLKIAETRLKQIMSSF